MLRSATSTVPDPCRGLRVPDVEWVQTLYPSLAQHPNWWIEFRFAEDRLEGSKNPPVAVQFLREPAAIASHLRDHRALAAQRADHLQHRRSGPWPAGMFWGIQPRITQRGSREHVAAFVAMACSLDVSEWEEWPEKERPRIIWETLHGCPQPPSVIMWTGTGFDALWLLREPLFDRRRGEQVQKAISHCLHANAANDAAMLLRWPQTFNYRGLPDKRAHSVRVVWWQPQIRFAFEKLLEAFLPYAPPAGNLPIIDKRQTAGWKSFQHLMEEHEEFRSLWNQDRSTCAAEEQHALNVALANMLAMHDVVRADYNELAALASWNVLRPPPTGDLLKAWQEARGDDGPGTPRRRVRVLPQEIAPHPPAETPTVPALPGLLLDTLPDTAWTDWARLYRSAVGTCTEAADEFHYLALLTVLGTAFGRSVVVHCGRPLYLNTYTILVGPTGDRKSTAAQLALEVLARVAPQTLVLNGVGSQEGLMERMAAVDASGGPQSTFWYVDEMASLLKKARRESSGSLIEFITEIFHCPDFKTHSTRSKSIHLPHPTLSILAGSTPTWLEAALSPEDILGGFANRFVFVTGQPKAENPLPPSPDRQSLDTLVSWMQRVTQTPAREVGWTPSARAQWTEFYLEWRRSTASCTEQVAALLRRIDLYIIKFAAMTAAMEQATQISRAHLSAAIDIGRFIAGCAYRQLGELAASADCRLEALIEKKLREAQGEMRRKQLRQCLGGRITGEKLDRVLNAMERNGLIRQLNDTSTRSSSRLVQLT